METRPSRVAGNPPRLAAFNALQMALFPVAIVTVYQREEIGLDMTDILLLQALFGLAMAVLEFPSGYLADRIGYRRTLLIASPISILGWVLYLVANDFTGLLLAEIVLGISLALISGCDSALLYESLVETDREGEFTRWTGRVRFAGQGSEGTIALFAGILYAFSPSLPFLLQIPLWVVNFFIALGLREPARHVPLETSHLRHMWEVTRGALVDRPELRAIISLTVTLGLASYLLVWIVPLYAIEAGLSVAWVGPMWTIANYIVALSALASHRVDRRLGTPNLALLGVFLVAVGYAGMATVHAWWGFIFYFAVTIIRGLVQPALVHREQRLIPTADRASFLSLRSLIFRLSFLVLGPIVGVAIDEYGNHATLAVAGFVLVFACVFSWWQARTAFVDEAH